MSDFKYLRCVLNESDTGDAKCCTMVASGRKVAGAIRSLVNAMGLQLESLLLPVFMYGSETLIWRVKDKGVV